MQRYRLNRVDLRDWIEAAYAGGGFGWLGDELRWMANVPLMYQTLAAPDGTHEFIRVPERGEEHPGGAPAYWSSLLHLLVYSFGWRVPGAGLQWWVNEGRPVDDPRLALIEQVWVADGQFDWFCAWIWSSVPTFGVGADEASDPGGAWAPDPDWRRQVEQSIERSGIWAPYGGGSDPLHLAPHIDDLWSASTPDALSLILDARRRPRGVLLADNLAGWCRFLHEAPDVRALHPSGRSWRIDVVVKPIGWLGTFRRSRDTGRWFAGPHRLHTVGNPT